MTTAKLQNCVLAYIIHGELRSNGPGPDKIVNKIYDFCLAIA
jgi:hypothetical protein